MIADVQCYDCCKRKLYGLAEQYSLEEKTKKELYEKANQVLEETQEVAAPVLMSRLLRAMREVIGEDDFYKEAKNKYNKLLLSQEEELWQEIERSNDPFLAGVQYAITGNYIDFGALGDVNVEKLNELLARRKEIKIDLQELAYLKEELEKATELVYIVDNAGEIVLDKLLIRFIRKGYPHLHITVMVRDIPVLNDATKEDAKMICLPGEITVITNGSIVPGTPMDEISDQAKEAIKKADLCIAKGQGNFETLKDCGENIYYMFLCKCDLFVKKFDVERFTPMLKNEKRMK